MRVLADGRVLGTLEERLMARIWAKPGCWAWKGSHFQANGYALFSVKTERGWQPTVAHRVVYEVFVGPIPAGLHIDHLCRNHGCVNPNHLEAVTPRTNVMRGVGPSAREARQTECHAGHPFAGENLFVRRSGKRECRTCCRARDAVRRSRRREVVGT